MTASPAPALHVIAGPGGAGGWDNVVAEVAALVGLEPVVESFPAAGGAAERAQALLNAAATMDGAVLVLPHQPAGPGAGPAAVRRVLVPFDRSGAESDVLDPLIRRALAADLAVEQVHVLTDQSRPAIWEGAGHHARAWLDELRRRYQVGTASLRVRAGSPAAVLCALAAGVDLVVACWSGETGAGRARVLREIVADTPSPLLLVRAASPTWGAGSG